LARISSNDLDHDPGEHHRRCDDGVPVAKNKRVDARVFQAEPNRVLVSLRWLAAVMSTGFAAAPKGGMNLRKAASRSGGIAISVKLFVDAGVGQQHP